MVAQREEETYARFGFERQNQHSSAKWRVSFRHLQYEHRLLTSNLLGWPPPATASRGWTSLVGNRTVVEEVILAPASAADVALAGLASTGIPDSMPSGAVSDEVAGLMARVRPPWAGRVAVVNLRCRKFYICTLLAV